MQKKIEQIKTRIKKSYSDKLDGNLPYGMDENDWNKLMADWASELNQLEMKLEECNQKSKVLYNCLNLIMAFCNQYKRTVGLRRKNRKFDYFLL